MKVFYVIIVLFGISCNNGSGTEENRREDSLQNLSADSTKKAIASDTISKNTMIPDTSGETENEIIDITNSAKDLPVKELKETISNINQSIEVHISELATGILNIKLTPKNPKTNIRISQIIMPDGSSDGPFGQDLKYKLKHSGSYTLVISKSNMASGSPVGEVSINIEKD